MELMKQGVQRPNGLGMHYGAVSPEAVADATLGDVEDWEQRYEDLEIEHAKAMEKADGLHDTVVLLLEALRDVLPETCASHAEPEAGCPDCAAIALYAQVAPQFGPRVEPCPECRSGKHQNCDDQTMHPETELMVPCPCPCAEAGHE